MTSINKEKSRDDSGHHIVQVLTLNPLRWINRVDWGVIRQSLLLTVAAILYAPTASADMDGTSLKSACQSKNRAQRLICRAYLDAVVETHTLTAAALKGLLDTHGYHEPVPILWCPPHPHRLRSDAAFYDAHIDFSQAQPVVVAYLNKHPEELHLTAAQLVIEAFVEAFPFSQSGHSCSSQIGEPIRDAK